MARRADVALRWGCGVRRVVVVGNSGSGKTTLARSVADLLGARHVELDALYHQPGWVGLDDASFIAATAAATATEPWVADGNYQRALSSTLWPRADTVLWLDYPRWVVVPRILARTARRLVGRAELWNGNRESVRNLVRLDPKENIILWSITQHRRYQDQYAQAIAEGRFDQAEVLHLRHPRDAARLLDQLAATGGRGSTVPSVNELDFSRCAFPDGRWGTANAVARLGHRFASTGLGSWTIRSLVPLDRKVLEASGGRRTVLGPLGTPMMLLTTTGAKSGLERTTPMTYLPDGEDICVVGSNFGQQRHPAWSTNLLAHPSATVTIKGQQIPAHAQLLEGTDRDRVWANFEEAVVTYRAYRGRTDRTIRVFRFTKAAP